MTGRLVLRGVVLFAAIAVACTRPTVPPSLAVPASTDTLLPNVALTTHDGRRVRFYDDLVRGKVVLINFMFTSCTRYCPRTTANLVRVQQRLGARVGRDVFFVSISLDPTHDTPAVLKHYAEAVGAKPGWSFLTGDRDDIERLRRRLGVYDPDPVIDADRTQHAGVVVYGNDVLGRWAALPGLLAPERIAQAVRQVMAPAAPAGGRSSSTPAHELGVRPIEQREPDRERDRHRGEHEQQSDEAEPARRERSCAATPDRDGNFGDRP